MEPFQLFLIFLLLMSIVAFFMYRSDKEKARRHKWRTREIVLLLIGFFGGAFGALLGMRVFRHKTKHWYFWAVNIAGLVLQILLLTLMLR